MCELWCLIDDLMGGTLAMRKAGEKWLPRETAEEEEAYRIRLKRSILYNAFGDTVDKLSARPFSKPIVFKDNNQLPAKLLTLEKNADRQGTSLVKFCHQIFKDGVKYGMQLCLVDYPVVPEGATLADEIKNDWRPYFVRICPDDVIDIIEADGQLVELRYSEERQERKGKFGTTCALYVIRWTPEVVETYRVEENGTEQKLVSTRPHSHGRIPLFVGYTNETGKYMATPPLEDLAWLNVAHWQSYSDQRNILRFARLGMIVMTGLTEEEVNKTTTLAANKVWKFRNAESKVYYVEHTGKAIAAGAADLDSLEAKMMILGMQPLFEGGGKSTATARALDETRSQSLAQAWVGCLEEMLEAMYAYAAKIAKLTLPEKFSIVIDKEFGLSMKAGLDVQALIAMRAAGEISRETFLEEMKRRSVLADTVDIKEEIVHAKADGPSVSKQPGNAQDAKNSGDRKKNTGAMNDPTTSNPGGF